MVCVVYVYVAYFSLNLYHTPALSNMMCVTDSQGKIHPRFRNAGMTDNPANTSPPYSIRQTMPGREDDYIPPLYDLPVSLINHAVFGRNETAIAREDTPS